MTATEPLVDHRGNAIAPGCRVAYNWSGQIACGVVVSADPGVLDGWRHVKRAMIKVKAEFPANMAGEVSEVRSPKNVMVIFE